MGKSGSIRKHIKSGTGTRCVFIWGGGGGGGNNGGKFFFDPEESRALGQ